ncbi:MAG: glycosyltransferase [Bacteroidota bacterium]
MKKVLILSYYWPPSGGAGVQRCLKYVKYLRHFGWEPVVYTAENGSYPSIDHSLQNDVPEGVEIVRLPIWEPYEIYKKLLGMKKEERVQHGFIQENKEPGLMQKFSVWVRGNFFIPDARKFWIKPSVRFLRDYLRKHPVDAMLSSGPPHSMHMIAKGVKDSLGIPWIADFRDPWTQIDFYDQLYLTSWADRKHHRMEKAVLTTADRILTVNPNCAKGLVEVGAPQADVIYNGFDESDFPQEDRPPLSKHFELTHVGSLNKDRNPEALWKVLHQKCEEIEGFRQNLRIKLVGKVDWKIIDDLQRLGLEECLERSDYVSHDEACRLMCSSWVLLLLLNDTPNLEGITPGKMFEYLAARRPTLCIGSTTGDAAAILRKTEAGLSFGFKDEEGIAKAIDGYYQQYLDKQTEPAGKNIDFYSRKNATSQLADFLNQLV